MSSLELPEDLVAERSLIATLCAPGAEDALEDILPQLQPDHFMDPAHRAMWTAIQCLHDRCEPEINAVVLRDELARHAQLDRVGDFSGIIEILSGEEVGRPQVLADILIRHRQARLLMRAGERLTERANAPGEDLPGLCHEVKDFLDAVSEGGEGPLQSVDTANWLDREPPPVEYLLQGLLPAHESCILVGKSNSGKGQIAMELSFAVATGRGIFGKEGTGRPAPAIFVEMEDSPEELHRRYRRCATLMRQDETWSDADERNLRQNWRPFFPRWRSASPKTLPSITPQILKECRHIAKASGSQVGLIILSTYSALAQGDENDAGDQRQFAACCSQLRDVTGATILPLHHVKKGMASSDTSKSAASMAERLDPERLRGTSAIGASVRVVIQIEPLTAREAEKLQLDEERAAAGNYVVLALTKTASGPKGEWIALQQREFGQPDGGMFAPMPEGDRICASLRSKAAQAKLGVAEAVLSAIADGITSRDELAQRHWPSDLNPMAKLQACLQNMRGRSGWLQKGSELKLTVKGIEKLQELRRARQ